MNFSSILRALGLAAFAAAVTAPVQADSFTSSASSAGSASSASISDSISDSVGSSSNSGEDKKRVAAGEYRVIDVARAPAKPDATRMTLRATAAGAVREFHLDVPNRALAARPVAAGELVQVSERAYGYEFAHADTRRSFFLALQDDWYRELGSHKVTI